MFYDVYRVGQRSAPLQWWPRGGQWHQRSRYPGSAITPQKLAMTPQGLLISPRTWSHHPMLNSILNRDWSNSVPGRQIPEGIDITVLSIDVPASNRKCFMMFPNIFRVFHDISLVVHSVFNCFSSGSWCFTCVLWCYTPSSSFILIVSESCWCQQEILSGAPKGSLCTAVFPWIIEPSPLWKNSLQANMFRCS